MKIDSSISKPNLKVSIEAAFSKAKASGEREGAIPSLIIDQLAQDLSSAIDAYIAATNLTVTVQPGQVVTTPAGAGSTTTPGIGQ